MLVELVITQQLNPHKWYYNMTKFYENPNYKKLSDADFKAIANKYNVPESRIRAVAEVEARGSGFNSQGYLTALYEPHIAYRYSTGVVRDKLVAAGIAYQDWRREYPKTSYPRIDQATSIAGEELAAMATSFGMGQVMGFNHDLLGFKTALELVKWLAISEANQIEGIILFAKSKGILKPLIDGEFDVFANGYNGSGYKQNNYDIKLRDADRRWQVKLSGKTNVNIQPVSYETIDVGIKGKSVERVQEALNAIGLDVPVDGDFGPVTENAVKDFQEANDLNPDGQVGAVTKTAIADKLQENGIDPKTVLDHPTTIPALETPTGRFSQFWYWLGSLPLAGGLSWFNDWRVLVALLGGIILLAVFGILAQNKIITAYKNYKQAIGE